MAKVWINSATITIAIAVRPSVRGHTSQEQTEKKKAAR